MRRGLAPYVKVGKAMSKRCASCLNRIKQTWSLSNQNRFLQLHYSRSGETFFCFMTTIVIGTSTPNHYQKAIKKLNNIVIA